MRMQQRWMGLAIAGALAVAVAIPAGAQSVDVKPTQKVKRDKYVLTAEEIAERPELTNAYDAVKQLRNQFLKQTRSKGGLAGGSSVGGYRPDAVGKPVSLSGGGSSGGSTGEAKPTGESGLSGGAGDDKASEYGSASGGTYVSAVLYIDEVKQQDVEEMKNIRSAEVIEIRFLTGNQAAGRYGAGHEAGAIMVKTSRLGKKP